MAQTRLMKSIILFLPALLLISCLQAQAPDHFNYYGEVPSKNDFLPVTARSGRCYINQAWAQYLGDSAVSLGCDWTRAMEADPLTWPIQVLCEPGTADRQAPVPLADGSFIYFPGTGNPFRGTMPKQCSFISAHSLIATPRGEVKVATLKMGDTIYTGSIYEDYETYEGSSPDASHRIGEHKFVVAEPLRLVRQLHIAPGQHIVRITLADGRVLEAFPGQMFKITVENGGVVYAGTVQEGDAVDGSKVKRKEVLEYAESFAYDILPYGDMFDYRDLGPMYGTSTYWANGVLITSGMWGWFSTSDMLRMGW